MGIATSGLVESPIFAAMEPQVVALLGQYNSQNLANIAWSYAVTGVDDPELLVHPLPKENRENG